MKTIIKKLILFSVIAINLAMLNSVAFAAPDPPGPVGDPDAATKLSASHNFLEAIEKEDCIDDKQGDNNFIITVIEEPLDIKENEQAADFRYRKCYRHSFTFVEKNGSYMNQSELSKTACLESASAKAKEINKEYKDTPEIAKYKSANYFCKEVQVILSKGGTSMIYGYIGMLYQWGASIAGLIAVTIIIISGIQISAAGGDPEAVGSAKKRILQSISGIVVLFLSGLILYTINPNFFTASP